MTRRKRFHFVTDAQGVVLWRGIRMTDLLAFLEAHGETEALVRVEERAYRLALRPEQEAEKVPLWPNSPPPF